MEHNRFVSVDGTDKFPDRESMIRGDYVWSLKVNGEDWEKTWVTWDDVFKDGGTMEFVLDKEASDWSRRGERPPSPASEDDDGK
ncbi:MAG: hypothetical protein L6R42_006313 [Xanthoria sp. 1 TBL-2021]|nr:MAG: hypothetical protein L6R42_006313 [Xanthoria sp. 1 TBL-2021]